MRDTLNVDLAMLREQQENLETANRADHKGRTARLEGLQEFLSKLIHELEGHGSIVVKKHRTH